MIMNHNIIRRLEFANQGKLASSNTKMDPCFFFFFEWTCMIHHPTVASKLTLTSAARVPSAVIRKATNPSGASRPRSLLDVLAAPCSRNQSIALVISPSACSNAFLHSTTGAPDLRRNSLMRSEVATTTVADDVAEDEKE